MTAQSSTSQPTWSRDGGHLGSDFHPFGSLLTLPEKLGERSDGTGTLPTSRPLTGVLARFCH